MKDIFFVNRHLKDFNPILAGWEACKPGHSFGPHIRPYTLLHYVEKGSGFLEKNGQIYPVRAGEAFLILPGEVTTYTADLADPWIYRWIGFDGSMAEDFRKLEPVFRVSATQFRAINEQDGTPFGVREYRVAACLFEIYAELFAEEKHGNHYVRRVEDYIQAAYMQEIRVEEIAASLNLDRRYLSRLFKERTGKTVQEYLISVRMHAASELLSNGYGVAEAGEMCGYPDACNFSKMFKRFFGVSPSKQEKKTEPVN